MTKSRKVKNSDGCNQIEYFYIPVLKYKTHAQVFTSYADGSTKTYKFGSRTEKYSGNERNSHSDANRFLSNDLHSTIYDLFAQFVITTVKDMDSKLNKKHGYRVIDTTDHLLVLDSRRYPEYKDYKRYYSLINRLFSQMSAFEPINNLKNELQVAIEFFEGIPANYQGTKKADIKMRYASYYNLAKIYYYLDEPDQSIFYYQKVIENDYHEGQSKRNIKDIEKLKDLFSINQVNTRHFPIEIQHFNSPSNFTEESFNYLDAEIKIAENQLIEGKIEMSSSIENVINELQQSDVVKIKFLNDYDEIESKDISSDFIDSIQLEDIKLQRISYATKSKNTKVNSGKISEGSIINGLAVELYASEKVALYNFNQELILKKPNDTNGKSTSSTVFSFAFKKKLGQFFDDCTGIQTSIKSGDYKNNSESLLLAVKAYTQCKMTKL